MKKILLAALMLSNVAVVAQEEATNTPKVEKKIIKKEDEITRQPKKKDIKKEIANVVEDVVEEIAPCIQDAAE